MRRFATFFRWQSILLLSDNLSCRFTRTRIARCLLKKAFRFVGGPITGKPLTLLPPCLAFAWPFKGFLRNPEERSQLLTVELFAEARNAITSHEFVKADRVLHRLLQHLHTAHMAGWLDDHQYVDRRARVYSDLASVQLMRHQHVEAEQLLIQIIRDCHTLAVPLDSPIVVELSLKLALVYQHLGRARDADLGFSYCISMLSPRLNDCDLDSEEQANVKALLGMSHNYYSKFLYEAGSLQSALEHAQQALTLARQLYPPDHINCLNLSSDIVVILTDLNRFSEATALLDQLVAQIQTQLASTVDESLLSCLAGVLLHRVVLHVRSGQLAEAAECADQVEVLLKKIESPPDEIRSQLDRVRKEHNLRP